MAVSPIGRSTVAHTTQTHAGAPQNEVTPIDPHQLT